MEQSFLMQTHPLISHWAFDQYSCTQLALVSLLHLFQIPQYLQDAIQLYEGVLVSLELELAVFVLLIAPREVFFWHRGEGCYVQEVK